MSQAVEDANARYLGFDFGLRRIGVAVGQRITATAQPVQTLPAIDGVPDWNAVRTLVGLWQPAALIVGLPLQLDGNEQEISQRARAFGKALTRHCQLPVHYVDERFSSREAEAHFVMQRKAGTKRRRDAAALDAVAAAIILENWLNQ